tara:strand:+ start:291 stop:512 length:222 start_codon:yes stop_codon:yes gene_type:complete
MKNFFILAVRKDVIKRALKIALVVGFILAAINHGDRILLDQMKSIDWIKVVVTFFVPYSVATISAVLTLIKKS